MRDCVLYSEQTKEKTLFKVNPHDVLIEQFQDNQWYQTLILPHKDAEALMQHLLNQTDSKEI